MLTFGAIAIIRRSNHFSGLQIGHSYQLQYILYNVDTMKHTIGGKMAQGVPSYPRDGQNGPILYFFISSIS